MKYKYLVLSFIFTFAFMQLKAQTTFSLPVGSWHKIATVGGQHASFEYMYSQAAAYNPSIAKGEIHFINSQNFSIQHHQTMGYAAWRQPKFALVNNGGTSEIWVKAGTDASPGNFVISNNRNSILVPDPIHPDNTLENLDGKNYVEYVLPDNMHAFYGNMLNDKGSFQTNGNIGIGISPGVKLDIKSNLGVDAIMIRDHASAPRFSIAQMANYAGNLIDSKNIDLVLQSGEAGGTGGNLVFKTGLMANPIETVRINKDGKVGIGTSNLTEGYKLFVKEGIRTEKVKVDVAGQNGWADYVFEPTYKLLTLFQVESFIKENKHLPDVPSAKEVEEDGIDLGKMDATLLKKIEELTLYVIEQNKRIELQTEKLKKQDSALKVQNKELDELKRMINNK